MLPHMSKKKDDILPLSDKEYYQKKRKGGRPKVPDELKRDTKFPLCLTKEEHARLKGMTLNSNYNSVSDFIRAMLFENTVKLYYEDKNTEKMFFQLSKIGTNINQIARFFNVMKDNYNAISKDEIEKYMLQLEKHVDDINKLDED